jgi:hypothetical protein
VYHIVGGDVSMNGCGMENCYGNGYLNLGLDDSANVTVNNGTTFNLRSEYVPDVALGAGWAVGPFQFGRGPKSLVINGGRYDFTNTSAPVVADLVAFNYDEGAYGAINRTMVWINAPVAPSDLLAPFAGRGNFNRYCRNALDVRNTYTRFVSGTGTVITIPIVSQVNATQRHVLRILAVNRNPNTNVPYGTELTLDFASLNTLVNISYWNSKNVASVAASGMNLQITLSNALVNPEIIIEPLSTDQKLIDLDNITIA